MLMGVQPSPCITFWRCMGEADQYHPKSIGSYVRWIGQNSVDTQATGHVDGRSGSHRQRQANICAAIRPRRPSAFISRNVTHYENTSNWTTPRSVPPPDIYVRRRWRSSIPGGAVLDEMATGVPAELAAPTKVDRDTAGPVCRRCRPHARRVAAPERLATGTCRGGNKKRG